MNNKQVQLEIQLLESNNYFVINLDEQKKKCVLTKQFHLRQEQYELPIYELQVMKLQIAKSELKNYKLRAVIDILEDENNIEFELDFEDIL